MTAARYHMEKTLEAVDPMVQRLSDHVDDVLPQTTLFRFSICVSESLTNLVLHARNCAPDARVDIVVDITDPDVAVEIFDPDGADAFDLRDYARDLADVDELAEGGRGLGLIVECADSVSYGPVETRNRLKLTFNREA